jgi:cell division septal protein FtsQ
MVLEEYSPVHTHTGEDRQSWMAKAMMMMMMVVMLMVMLMVMVMVMIMVIVIVMGTVRYAPMMEKIEGGYQQEGNISGYVGSRVAQGK